MWWLSFLPSSFDRLIQGWSWGRRTEGWSWWGQRLLESQVVTYWFLFICSGTLPQASSFWILQDLFFSWKDRRKEPRTLQRTLWWPEWMMRYLHVGVKEVFIVGSFVDELFVLEFVGWINLYLPIVLIAPATIIRPMMIARKVAVASDINI